MGALPQASGKNMVLLSESSTATLNTALKQTKENNMFTLPLTLRMQPSPEEGISQCYLKSIVAAQCAAA